MRPTFFGEYFDVKTHIAPTNLAYTAKALELHTDTPAEDAAPERIGLLMGGRAEPVS